MYPNKMKRNKYNAKPNLQMLFFLTTMKLTDFLKRIIYLRFKERLGVALSETVVEQVFFKSSVSYNISIH